MTLPPHPLIQTFSIPEINDTLEGPLRNFSALWDKNFSLENLHTPPSPFSSVNLIVTGNFPKHSTEGSLAMFFGTARQKFRQNILT